MSIASVVAAGPLTFNPKVKLQSVFDLQMALVKLRDMTASPDGYYGPLTKTGVEALQKFEHLPVDGTLVDLATAKAIDAEVAKIILPPVLQVVGDPPWFVIATSLLGIYEFAGDKDNDTILAWARALGGMIAKEYKHDSVPWCMLFVQYCLFKAGFPHLDSLWALDDASYGIKLKGLARGAIGTKTRSGGGHTFFIVGRSLNGNVVIRGGNQSDMVCDEEIDPSQVHSVTWPAGYPIPALIGFNTLPLVKDAPRSRRES